MGRQTSFTLEQITQMIENHEYVGCHSNVPGLYPLGVLLNEVGIILSETADRAAEDLLVNILAQKDKHERFIACCYLLMNANKLSGEGKLFLKEFEKLPGNSALVADCRKRVHELN